MKNRPGRYTLLDHVRALGSVPIYFESGTHWLYGFGHELVAALVEKTSGMTIGEFLKKKIFEPLGMKNTGYRLNENQWEQMTALFHRNDDGSYSVHEAGLADQHRSRAPFLRRVYAQHVPQRRRVPSHESPGGSVRNAVSPALIRSP